MEAFQDAGPELRKRTAVPGRIERARGALGTKTGEFSRSRYETERAFDVRDQVACRSVERREARVLFSPPRSWQDAVEQDRPRFVVPALAVGELDVGGDQLAAKRVGEDGGGDPVSTAISCTPASPRRRNG